MKRTDIRMLGHFPSESTVNYGACQYRRYVVAHWTDAEMMRYSVSFLVPTNAAAKNDLTAAPVQYEVDRFGPQRPGAYPSRMTWTAAMLDPHRTPALVIKPAAIVMKWLHENAAALQHWTAFFRTYHK